MINSKYTRLLTELNQECKATQDVNLDTTNNNNLEKISFYIPEFLQWEEGGRSRTKEVQQTYSRDLNFLIHVIGDKPTNKERTKSLLRRALKEITIRRAPVSVDTDNVSDESVVKFADIVLQQTIERVKKEGGNATDKAVAAILLKIKKDYGK